MVEPTAKWVRSSYCADNACVEVAPMGSYVIMRDSKNIDQPSIRFRRADWNGFLDMVKAEYHSL